MKSLFSGLLTAAALALAIAPAATAQTAAPTTAYAGPRFPGGPDSLRAFVYRSIRQAGPAPAGRILLNFDLPEDGKPRKLRLVRPPDPIDKALVNAAGKALDYQEPRMPSWQPGTPEADAKRNNETLKVSLVLDFTPTAPAARPYHYADQSPVFQSIADFVRERQIKYATPGKPAEPVSFAKVLTTYIQMQVRYPAEALRNQQQGQVYAYFEVTERGAVEHAEILGTASSALDAEVLRVVRQLPAASAPALLQGQPVRVYYVLPITFWIQ